MNTAWSLYQNPRRTRADLLDFRDRRLRRLISFAYAHVSFYQEWFDAAGVHPEDIRHAEDLTALPLLSKGDLRNAPLASRLARGSDPAKLVTHNTSGSTGEPFTIYRTRAEENLLQLLRLRAAWQYGFRFLDRRADLTAPLTGGAADPVRRAAKMLRVTPVESVDTTRDGDYLLRDIARIKPEVLTGYPGVLSHAARRLSDRPDLYIRPRLVIAGGEPMTTLMRKQIEGGFKAPVYDMYGANEFNLLAWQCPENQHLHVCDDGVVVEILRNGQPVKEGEQGEVVVTGLFSMAMPFIRYRTGDLATRGSDSCPCGQPFSILDGIHGRTADYFRLPDGRTVQPFSVLDPAMIYEDAWIDQHQLAQTAPDRIVLRVRLRREPRPGECERLIATAERATHPARFELEFVDGFEPHPSGKFRSYLGLEDARQT